MAVSVARLTEASTTPSTRVSAFWTRPTQEAQVMPPMSKLVSAVQAGAAASFMAVAGVAAAVAARPGEGVVVVISVLLGAGLVLSGRAQEARS